MKKWGVIYLAWGLGVLSAAAVAYWFWVQSYGQDTEEE